MATSRHCRKWKIWLLILSLRTQSRNSLANTIARFLRAFTDWKRFHSDISMCLAPDKIRDHSIQVLYRDLSARSVLTNSQLYSETANSRVTLHTSIMSWPRISRLQRRRKVLAT